jgi:hypothetical protein
MRERFEGQKRGTSLQIITHEIYRIRHSLSLATREAPSALAPGTTLHSVAFEVSHISDDWILFHDVVGQAMRLDVWRASDGLVVEECGEKTRRSGGMICRRSAFRAGGISFGSTATDAIYRGSGRHWAAGEVDRGHTDQVRERSLSILFSFSKRQYTPGDTPKPSPRCWRKLRCRLRR